MVDSVEIELQDGPPRRVSILLYDALDFSTDHDDGGGQTRESLSRIASTSAADAGLDLACWCALDQPCHADVLLRIANSRPK